MFMVTLKRCLDIARINIKHNFLPQIVIALLIIILAPVIFGITGLDSKAAAVPLEMFISLIGIIILTMIFAPENADDVQQTVESKYISPITVYIIRIIIALTVLTVLIFAFVLLMQLRECEVSFKLAAGTFVTAMFIGSIGFFTYGISNNITVGFMVPILYYAFNLTGGSKYVGKLYLFSMTQGSYDEKIWLLFVGILLITLTLVVRKVLLKLR